VYLSGINFVVWKEANIGLM